MIIIAATLAMVETTAAATKCDDFDDFDDDVDDDDGNFIVARFSRLQGNKRT